MAAAAPRRPNLKTNLISTKKERRTTEEQAGVFFWPHSRKMRFSAPASHCPPVFTPRFSCTDLKDLMGGISLAVAGTLPMTHVFVMRIWAPELMSC